MAKALKEKLEDQLQYSGTEEPDIIKAETGNVIPFTRPEEQVASVVPDFVITLDEARRRISMLQQFVKEMLLMILSSIWLTIKKWWLGTGVKLPFPI